MSKERIFVLMYFSVFQQNAFTLQFAVTEDNEDTHGKIHRKKCSSGVVSNIQLLQSIQKYGKECSLQ